MWTCPKCATKVDPSFDVCWSCGTGRDGVEDPTFVSADAAQPAPSPLDRDMPLGDEPIPEAAPPLENLVEAYWASDLMQATFLADKLSEEGMPAVADTHDMHDAPEACVMPLASGFARLTSRGPKPGSKLTTFSTRPSTAASTAIDPGL